MDHYYLSKEDWETLSELGFNRLFSQIPSKIKSTFTRTYNKSVHPLPFNDQLKPKRSVSGGLGDVPDNEDVIVNDEIVEEEEEEEVEIVFKEAKPKTKGKGKAKAKK